MVVLARKRCKRSVVKFPSGDAAAFAVFHDEVEHEILDEKFCRVAQGLSVERVQHGVACAVSGGASALCGRAFAHILHHAAKGRW